jgi:hypothetical protein
MDSLISAIQDVVAAEPEAEIQPDPTQPGDIAIETKLNDEIRTPAQADDAVETELTEEMKAAHPKWEPAFCENSDGATEIQLTAEISELWSQHTELSGTRRATAKELRLLRARLAEKLHEMKSLLSRPGRGGEWRGWLRERAIPRSTADRLVSRYAERLNVNNEGNVPSGAISESGEADAEKLAKNVWQRVGKLLTTDESVIQFIGQIAELAGLGHEQSSDGLVIFKPVPKPAAEMPAAVPASGPLPQAPDEIPAATEEPKDETAATPTEVGLVAEAADASDGVAA